MAKFKYNAPKSKVGNLSIVSCSLLLIKRFTFLDLGIDLH